MGLRPSPLQACRPRGRGGYAGGIGFFLIWVGLECSALAASPNLKIIRGDAKEQITELKFKSELLEVQTEAVQPTGQKAFVVLEGNYQKPNWIFLFNDQIIKRSDNGTFKMKVHIVNKVSLLQFKAIGPRGDLMKETVKLSFDDWDNFKILLATGPKRTPSSLSAGVNVTYIGYKEDGIANYTAGVFTGKASFSHSLFHKNFSYGISTYFTIAPFYRVRPATIRFVGVNFRIGYALPFIKDPWRVSLSTGMYYTTTFASGEQFGFKDMAGPQLYPTIVRTLKGGNSIVSYFKFSPVSSGTDALKFKNRELAFGGAFVQLLKNGHPLSYSLDVASFQLAIPIVTGTEAKISSTSVSLGIGYGF